MKWTCLIFLFHPHEDANSWNLSASVPFSLVYLPPGLLFTRSWIRAQHNEIYVPARLPNILQSCNWTWCMMDPVVITDCCISGFHFTCDWNQIITKNTSNNVTSPTYKCTSMKNDTIEYMSSHNSSLVLDGYWVKVDKHWLALFRYLVDMES